MKITAKLTFFMIALLLSCKSDTKKVDGNSYETDSNTTTIIPKDKEIENALYHGTFLKNENGFDVAILENTIYLLNDNPSEEEKTNHFFLEITKNNSTLPTKDLLPKDLYFSDSLSTSFSNVHVYKYVINESEAPFNILIGQFDNNNRTWHSFIHAEKLKNIENDYKNEYLNNTKTNIYLNDFESAFDEGYFMKSQSNYDLLLDDHTLYYIKPNGVTSDLEERFFLHVTFEDNERIVLDFKPTDFQIDKLLGAKYKNFIVLKKEIPKNKKIIEIGTGQFKNDVQFWSIVYQIENLYDDMAFIYDDQYKEYFRQKY